jgi:hypothetical protein
MFAPINVAGPDQRRKALMAKLGQQQQTNMGGSRSAAQSVGQAFHPAVMHALVRASSTQGTNVLPSVLARLGILGHQNAEEVSQGFGAPISSYHPGVGVQTDQNAPGIPVAGSADPGQAAAALAGPATTTDQQGNTVYAAGQAIPASTGSTNPVLAAQMADPTSAYNAAAAASTPAGNGVLDGGMTQRGGLVPLGGGHFFDPATGQIAFNPSVGAAGLPGTRMVAQ